MKSPIRPVLVALLTAPWLVISCVSTGTHEAVIMELEETRSQLDQTTGDLEQTNSELAAKAEKAKELDNDLATALQQNTQLATKVTSMGANVESLLGEKDSLAEQRKKLEAEIEEMRRMRAAAEARNAEYRTVLSKLHSMIDAGTLEVKFRGGRMLVTMSSDVLFPPGGTRLKPAATEAIQSLAVTIAGFPNRKFQVIGHSDATPIRTSRFPSNWELSSQRAIEVVKVLVEAGVPPEMLSAAGSAEFDPLVENDTAENQEMNRRVELVFVPKLDELPGFGDVLSGEK